jgi:hypothetical protein
MERRLATRTKLCSRLPLGAEGPRNARYHRNVHSSAVKGDLAGTGRSAAAWGAAGGPHQAGAPGAAGGPIPAKLKLCSSIGGEPIQLGAGASRVRVAGQRADRLVSCTDASAAPAPAGPVQAASACRCGHAPERRCLSNISCGGTSRMGWHRGSACRAHSAEPGSAWPSTSSPAWSQPPSPLRCLPWRCPSPPSKLPPAARPARGGARRPAQPLSRRQGAAQRSVRPTRQTHQLGMPAAAPGPYDLLR